ncbi:hypothetical protein M0Q97_13330, partial [Candidatus Dojkabacteria bacterium]|nr:hypothetical protein [Candidatus Dojkabacteria bacterium]
TTSFSSCIKGEIIMTKDDFAIVNSKSEKQFSNPRNAASGISRGYDGKFCEYLTIVYYDIMLEKSLNEKLEIINTNSFFKTNFEIVTNIFKLNELYVAYKEHRNDYNYQMDGLVLAVNDYELKEKMGSINNRPKGAIAIKFPAQEVSTRLLDVEWNVTRTGRVNPKAKLAAVEVDGSIVEFATLHNIGYIEDLDLRIGDLVTIKKAGDIIPAVVKVLVSGCGIKVEAPEKCPFCNSYLEKKGSYIMCNNSDCPKKNFDKIVHYCKTLEMDHVGIGLLEKLFDNNLVNSIPDLYKIQKKDLVKLDGIGETVAENFISELHKKSSITVEKFLVSLGMDGLGNKNSGILAKYINDEKYLDFGSLLNYIAEKNILENMFTGPTAKKIKNELIKNQDLSCELLPYIRIIEEKKKGSKLEGMSFCITGSLQHGKRDAYITIIKDNGGDYRASVGHGLTYLVTNDTESGSSKNKKAKELGIQIINEDELRKMMED